MIIKRLIVLVMAVVFTLGVLSLTASAQQEVKGTVSKMEGNQITIRDDSGKQITVSVQDPMTLKDLKVGDRVSVKDGKVIKEST